MMISYVIVPANEAHVVITPSKRFVASPFQQYRKNNGKTAYWHFPSWLPFIGQQVRKLDLTIREIPIEQLTYEKGQARYKLQSSLKFQIVDPELAALTFISDEDLVAQLEEVVRASVRAITVQFTVQDARSKKANVSKAIQEEIRDDLAAWGLKLVNFQLVDFEDAPNTTVVSDISKRREAEISSETRTQIAIKEELARLREIEKDQKVAEREESKKQKVAEQSKITREKEYEVKKVETVKQAEIDKEKAIVKANEEKEVAVIMKEQKKLEGEGTRLKLEEEAKGNAAETREKGIAEADALTEKQKALSKFDEESIKAMVAEKVVEKDRAIGIANAEAMGKADVKIFHGGDAGRIGFDFGEVLGGARLSDGGAASALVNKIARPNDLGFKDLDVDALVGKAEGSGAQIGTKKDVPSREDPIDSGVDHTSSSTSAQPEPKPETKPQLKPKKKVRRRY